MSLVARLYGLVALAVLPVVVIQGLNELALRRDRVAQAHQEALRLAQFAASELNGLLDGARTLLVALVHAPGLTIRDGDACSRLVGKVDDDLEKFVGLGVVDREGNWLCAQGGLPPGGFSSGGRGWFREAIGKGGFFVGGYTVSRRLGVGMLPVTLPLRDASGQVVGLVGISLNLEWLGRHLAERSMPPGASFGVADRYGTLILRLPDTELVGQPMHEAFRWKLEAPGPATLENRGPDGTGRIVGFVPPAGMVDRSLLVSVGLSTDAALAGVRAATRRGLLLMALGVALALLAARYAGRAFILQPMAALLGAAERWRAGDYGARVGLGGRRDELGRLGAAFDGMADGLAAHEREIERTLAALRESEARFREFAENSHDVLWMHDSRSGRVDYVSPAFAEVWGRPPEDLVEGRVDFPDTVHPDDRPLVRQAFADTLAGGLAAVTYRVVRPDGSVRWVRDSGFPIRDGAGEIVRLGGITRDVTAVKAIEDERERALREREVMLREINHRVKNNLQVIISLLRLQADRSGSAEVRAAFDEACGRVSTITELHVALFDGAQVGTLDFGAYLHDLCARLEIASRGANAADIRVEVDAESGAVDLDRAIPLGLIVNELVSNAVKHAFPDSRGGSIRVGFKRREGSGEYRLSVSDDGAGPKNGIAALPEGLGLQLVNGFVRRVRGRLTLAGGPGFEAVVDFPADPPRRGMGGGWSGPSPR